MQTARMTTPCTTTTAKHNTIFVSLELSRSTWSVTVLAAAVGPKMSRHQVRGGDMPRLLARFSDLQRKAQHRTGQVAPVIVIQEAGLDRFWIHRALIAEGIESHVADPASIAVSRRHRRAKTDRIDGLRSVTEKRGSPACLPGAEDADWRARLSCEPAERAVLLARDRRIRAAEQGPP